MELSDVWILLRTPGQVLRHFADTVGTMAGAGGHVVLVPHSNAGLYAPAVAASAGALGIVFVLPMSRQAGQVNTDSDVHRPLQAALEHIERGRAKASARRRPRS